MGSHSCTDCHAGTYNNLLGRTGCEECLSGYYTGEAGGTYCSQCAVNLGETSNLEKTACDDCVAGYYWSAELRCTPCPATVTCEARSTAADWRLAPGNWRSGDTSIDIHECRFGELSCPGDVTDGGYCAEGYVGPLCAVCARDHFLVLENECKRCDQGGPWLSSVLIGAVVLICSASVAATCIKSGANAKLLRAYKIGKTKGLTLVQLCQARSRRHVSSQSGAVTLYSLLR